MNPVNLANSLVVIVAALATPNIGTADVSTDPMEELKSCARTEDRNDRMACFESLGERILEQEARDMPPSTKPKTLVAAPPAAALTKPAAQIGQTGLPDDLGGPSFGKAAEEKTEEVPPARGHVRECRKTHDDLWYFYFDSGQEWRQSGKGTYRFENCDFYVTISKDFFGYKMQIEGGSKIRVRRVK